MPENKIQSIVDTLKGQDASSVKQSLRQVIKDLGLNKQLSVFAAKGV